MTQRSITRIIAVLVSFVAARAEAQWQQRDIPLVPGWNPVFLDVDPALERADDLFDGLPINAVWTPARNVGVTALPECADPNDPTCSPAIDTRWDVWVPPSDPDRIVTSLRIIRGGRVYLVRASAATTLSLVGEPHGGISTWQEGYNLRGGYVEDGDSAATFENYFRGAPALTSSPIYRIDPTGNARPIGDSATERIANATGYWFHAPAALEYDGPIAIDPATLRGVDFARSAVAHDLRITNLSNEAAAVQIQRTGGENAALVDPLLPSLAGNVPLSWQRYSEGAAENAIEWADLGTADLALLAKGEDGASFNLRIGVERMGLAPAIVDPDGGGSQYESLLEIRDGLGFLRRVPVAAQVAGSAKNIATSGGSAASPGLYQGVVRVSEVQWITAGARVWTNEDPTAPVFAEDGRCFGGGAEGSPCEGDEKCPGGTCSGYCIGGASDGSACVAATDCPGGRCSAESDSASLRPTASEFTFPVLVHFADDGSYHLLTEVALLWEPPNGTPAEPGRFVLATPACDPLVCDALEAGSVQDGEPFVRRLGTAAFSFAGDLLMSGSFADALGAIYDIAPDDPLNPFRHKYHPDHDCDRQGECLGVTRSMLFEFEPAPPAGDTRPGWGDRILGGTYSETIIGLHRESLSVGGRFELRRISTIGTLNGE